MGHLIVIVSILMLFFFGLGAIFFLFGIIKLMVNAAGGFGHADDERKK